MSLLLVVVLVFFSSSSSVSSHQYYVSDNCSSVTHTPCNPLSVYAGDMSQYSNSIFNFIGTSSINFTLRIESVQNITLHGLDHSPTIYCINSEFIVNYSSHVSFSNVSFQQCYIDFEYSSNITITGSIFKHPRLVGLRFFNAFDSKITSSIFDNVSPWIYYYPPQVCYNELHHYSLTLTNVTMTSRNPFFLLPGHGTSYNLSVIFDNINAISKQGTPYYNNHHFTESLFSLYITNSSFVSNLWAGFSFSFFRNWNSKYCDIKGIQSQSTIVIEDCQFHNNSYGLRFIGSYSELNNHHTIITVKSCSIHDNDFGLSVNGHLSTSIHISVIDTELVGNRRNEIIGYFSIILTNITVTKSSSTGLEIEENRLAVNNNTGVVGGGIAINGSSVVIEDCQFHNNSYGLRLIGSYSELNNYHTVITVKSCSIHDNNFGLSVSGHLSTSTVVIEDCRFHNNSYGLILIRSYSELNNHHTIITVKSCSIHDNNFGLSVDGHLSTSTIAIEDCQFHNNFYGLRLIGSYSELNNHHTIITVKSCSIHDNNFGLSVNGRLSTHISVIDTELVGNRRNEIIGYFSIILTNITVTKSSSTGLEIKENRLAVKNNTGVVGGGIAINGSSVVIEDCQFHNNSYGLRLIGGYSELNNYHTVITVKSCSIHNNDFGLSVNGHLSTSTVVIEDCRFHNNSYGLRLIGSYSELNNHHTIITVKSCSIHNNDFGLSVSGNLLTSTHISVIDTELVGNKRNEIIGYFSIILTNITVTKSLSVGLEIKENRLAVKNNTGVVGGGIAINGSSVVIEDCQFHNNSYGLRLIGGYSELNNYHTVITVKSCSIHNNDFGLSVNGHLSTSTVVIEDCRFHNNFYGLRLIGSYSELNNHHTIITVKSCSIHNNNYGLSVYGRLSTSTIVIEDCRFHNNSYGLMLIGSYSELNNHHTIINVESCSIHNNNYGLSVYGHLSTSTHISVIETELVGNRKNEIIGCFSIILNNITVTKSLSTGLVIIASVVTVENRLAVKNNTGVVGGGIAINGSSVVVLSSSAYLEFTGNHASYKGGGIYINEQTQCEFIHKYDSALIPLTLKDNTARVAGNDIYGRAYSSFNLLTSTNSKIGTSSDATIVTLCDPDSHDTRPIWDIEVQHVFPGQALKYNVAFFGLNYNNSYSPTDGTLMLAINGTLEINKYIASECSLVKYTPEYISYGRHIIVLAVTIDRSNLQHNISFIFNKCPIGFSVNSSGVCTCSFSRENVTCDINSLNITHNGLLWIGTYDTSTPFNANATNPDACVINEDCLLYCSPNSVTFKLNDTDTQCVNNRGQRMCGSCRDGYSLLMGSNKCDHCHNNYIIIAWIALFAVMGVLLVVLLITLNLTVSVGTLNGLLFYANIVKLYEPVFSKEEPLPVLSQVISWINLDFGFEVCFYNGMDSYGKQWLQFAFPLYLWIIIIIIIQLCKRYGKMSKLMGSHVVPVLCTLTFLSYTKLVRTIVIVLHKREVTLDCANESVRSVSLWYEDPNVEYAKGKHAGLFGFALLVSVFFVIPYTLFLLCHQVLEKHLSHLDLFKSWSRFKPIIDAYSGPMKDDYRFWPGLLLVARIPILLIVTFLQNESRVLLLAVAAIILSLSFIFGGVYRKKLNTIIEFWFLLNLCIIASLSVAFNDESKALIWYKTCLSVFIFSFILIVVYHLYLQLSHMKCYHALIKKLFKKQDEDDQDVTESHKTVDQQMREIVPSSTDVRLSTSRESVVDLF